MLSGRLLHVELSKVAVEGSDALRHFSAERKDFMVSAERLGYWETSIL
jgi:hypothetical protein